MGKTTQTKEDDVTKLQTILMEQMTGAWRHKNALIVGMSEQRRQLADVVGRVVVEGECASALVYGPR
eukprot:CAMPEP_0119130248 /NCGR_PEP_ID=MMETSP1310-20130426/7660_1 /TAXON_ID=464262 /ORGANISM="Genus nov. species nov., Strain RCC2339" /LENGTH=66 /DNA_ID=CAMNT_0007120739 /DNA_START=140 /DNA_END=337 /DNA_ORIENTATION=+